MANKLTPAKPAAPVISVRTLSGLELRVAAEFLENAAESYVDHSVNEFALPNSPVRCEIVKAAEKLYAKLSGNKPDKLSIDDGQICATDYVLFYYFAQRWGWLAHQLERGEPMPTLAKEELLTGASLLELLSRNDYEEYAKPKDDPDYSLPSTPEGRQLAEAVIRHKGLRDADKRIKAALAGEYGCDVHTTWLLACLAARCTGVAKTGPAAGLDFDIDYQIVAQANTTGEAMAEGAASGAGTLPVINRLGISPKWLTAWKKNVKSYHDVKSKDLRQYEVDCLMQYVNGEYPKSDEPPNFLRLGSKLGRYANSDITLIEENAIQLARYDATRWMPVFAGRYFGALLQIDYFAGATPQIPPLYFANPFAAALGMIIGCKKEALCMAKMLIHAHRLSMFHDSEFYPASQCILQIFATYLGEAPLKIHGEAASSVIYKTLAAHWRHPNANALVPLLLAACDEHTHRSALRQPNGYRIDFLDFTRTPVEILLIFKLREELGLPNPKLDHPLMNTPLGQLPKEVPFAMDELITAVMKRARAEGFDEKKALSDVEKAAAKVK